MIPQAELRIMVNPTNPPKPIGLDVIIDGLTVAVISADDFARAVKQWNEIEAKLPNEAI